MASVGLLPAAVLAPCADSAWRRTSLNWALASRAAAAWIAWWGEHSRVTVAAVTVAFFGAAVSRFCAPDPAGRTLLRRVIERFGLS